MKLASYKDGSRDGQLVVVSRDLTTAHYATDIAQTLQQVLDDWNLVVSTIGVGNAFVLEHLQAHRAASH